MAYTERVKYFFFSSRQMSLPMNADAGFIKHVILYPPAKVRLPVDHLIIYEYTTRLLELQRISVIKKC